MTLVLDMNLFNKLVVFIEETVKDRDASITTWNDGGGIVVSVNYKDGVEYKQETKHLSKNHVP